MRTRLLAYPLHYSRAKAVHNDTENVRNAYLARTCGPVDYSGGPQIGPRMAISLAQIAQGTPQNATLIKGLIMTVSGAYGRDYKSLKAAKQDWTDGKDFIIRDLFHGVGRYVNKEDAGAMSVMVRYQQDRRIGELQ